MSIKLLDILNELGVNNPNINVKKVSDFIESIVDGNDPNSKIFKHYEAVCRPYCNKYNINGWLDLYDLEKLSNQDLYQLYKDLKINFK